MLGLGLAATILENRRSVIIRAEKPLPRSDRNLMIQVMGSGKQYPFAAKRARQDVLSLLSSQVNFFKEMCIN